jgi:hypothetical protein
MRRHADGAAVEAVRLLGRPRREGLFPIFVGTEKEQVSDSSKEEYSCRNSSGATPNSELPTDDVINVSLQHRVARRDAIQCRPALERGVTF